MPALTRLSVASVGDVAITDFQRRIRLKTGDVGYVAAMALTY
ncbi:hypothetical protein N9N28_07125 [Rubripirellula amarantea]|nr:hypothetical protein [Rubripirellula amarantea]